MTPSGTDIYYYNKYRWRNVNKNGRHHNLKIYYTIKKHEFKETTHKSFPKRKKIHQKTSKTKKNQIIFIANNLNDRYLTWLSTKCGPPVSYQPKIYSRFHFSLFNFIFVKEEIKWFFDNKQLFFWRKLNLFFLLFLYQRNFFLRKVKISIGTKTVLIKLWVICFSTCIVKRNKNLLFLGCEITLEITCGLCENVFIMSEFLG